MIKKRVLLIDGDNMAHRALHRFGNFTNSEGHPSGVVFGVPYMVSSLITQFLPHTIYVVFDGGLASWRKAILPSYKSREHRIDVDYDAFYRQKADVAKVLISLGVRVIWEEGEEADDILAVLTHRLRGYLTLVSSDKDFNQLLRPGLKIFKPSNKTILTHENLQEEVGYTPSQCVDWLCLDGDDSDKIPGVFGMGKKRITNFLKVYGSIQAFLDTDDGFFGSISREAIETAYSRNYKLISLGYAWTKYWRKKPTPIYKCELFSRVEAIKVFRKYEVNLFDKPSFSINFKSLKP